MQVHPTMTYPGNAGYLHIVLLDSQMNYQKHISMTSTSDGIYDYQFFDVPEGQYYIIAGSNVDNKSIAECEIGEICGAYPEFKEKSLIQLNNNLNDIDFQVTINL